MGLHVSNIPETTIPAYTLAILRIVIDLTLYTQMIWTNTSKLKINTKSILAHTQQSPCQSVLNFSTRSM